MSCLFNSLSRFVQENPQTIRQRVCDFLEGDNILFDDVRSSDATMWENNTDLSKYVSSMRSPSVWGGAIEIKAFCEIWGVAVEVFSVQGKSLALFVPSVPSTKTARLQWTGSHYTPLPPLLDDVPPPISSEPPQPPHQIGGRAIKFRRI